MHRREVLVVLDAPQNRWTIPCADVFSVCQVVLCLLQGRKTTGGIFRRVKAIPSSERDGENGNRLEDQSKLAQSAAITWPPTWCRIKCKGKQALERAASPALSRSKGCRIKCKGEQALER